MLERIEVETPNQETHVVLSDVDENARGQRVREVLGQDGVERQYWYDDKTYRLTRLRSTRLDGGAVLQDLRYTYDVVGNIVQVTYPEDELYFEREVTSGTRLYVYDRLYRLTSSSGREHPGQQPTANSSQLFGQVPHPNDQNALQPYTESYSYDKNGNITQMKHSGEVNWTRDYVIDDSAGTNRLISHNRPSAPDPYTYTYDDAGNMTAMAHIASMLYTSGEQLAEADLGGGGVAYYGYAGGERARKVIDHGGWTERRMYLGGWERYRRANGSLSIERDTLHVYEGDRRIALIETLTRKDGKEIPVVDQEPRVRVQLDDHLGSACVEVDLAGKVIGYEEYFAYGATSFRMTDANADVSARRYRYIGKERDEETGLSYHSARYYAAWLGRWTTSDPAGLVDGPGTYSYCRGSPIGNTDRNGREKKNSWAVGHGVLANTLDRLDAASTNKNNGMMKRLAAATGRLLIALPAAGEEFVGRPLANIPHNLRRAFSLFRQAGHAFLAAYKLANDADSLNPQAFSQRLSRIKGSLALAQFGLRRMLKANSHLGEAVLAGASVAPWGKVVGGLLKQTRKLVGSLARRLRASAARRAAKAAGSAKGGAGDLAVVNAQSEDAIVSASARALAERRGGELFRLGDDLSGVSSQESIAVVGHGNSTSLSGLSPERLGRMLRESGANGQMVELISCRTGSRVYHQRVANAYRGTVRAPVDRVNVLFDGGVPRVRSNGAMSAFRPAGEGWKTVEPQGWIRGLITRFLGI